MTAETHIVSFVVQADPTHLEDISQRLNATAGVKVQANDPGGKMVITAEVETEAAIVEILEGFQKIRGVFGANLVFHQVEETAMLNQVLD